MNSKLYTVLILVALVAIFILQNSGVSELRFLFWTIAMSRALMFAFLVSIGIAAGWLLRGHSIHKSSKKQSSIT